MYRNDCLLHVCKTWEKPLRALKHDRLLEVEHFGCSALYFLLVSEPPMLPSKAGWEPLPGKGTRSARAQCDHSPTSAQASLPLTINQDACNHKTVWPLSRTHYYCFFSKHMVIYESLFFLSERDKYLAEKGAVSANEVIWKASSLPICCCFSWHLYTWENT